MGVENRDFDSSFFQSLVREIRRGKVGRYILGAKKCFKFINSKEKLSGDRTEGKRPSLRKFDFLLFQSGWMLWSSFHLTHREMTFSVG